MHLYLTKSTRENLNAESDIIYTVVRAVDEHRFRRWQ